MSYVAPTITASGVTFGQLQGFGLVGHLRALIAAQTLTEFQANLARLPERNRLGELFYGMDNAVRSWLEGAPIAAAEVNQRLLDYATVLHLLVAAVDEVATLVAANPGTPGVVIRERSRPPVTVRTWP